MAKRDKVYELEDLNKAQLIKLLLERTAFRPVTESEIVWQLFVTASEKHLKASNASTKIKITIENIDESFKQIKIVQRLGIEVDRLYAEVERVRENEALNNG